MAITEQSFTDLFRAKVEEEARRIVDDIARGSAEDFPAYKEMVGRVTGLVLAKRILTDLEDEYLKQPETQETPVDLSDLPTGPTESFSTATNPVNP